ncbi:MAG: extracellular solute-binding protein [Pirellulales bacterium]
MRRRTLIRPWWLVSIAVWAMAGCKPTPESTPAGDTRPARDVAVRLLVADDPALAAAISQVSGEWKARSGATISIAETTSAELVANEALPADVDAVIYPSALLGTLARRGWLTPLPEDYAGNRELAWSDTFELLQIAETRWQQSPLAVPLGSPVLSCYYRTDLFEKFHRRPPSTWKEYRELAEFFSRRENLGDAAPATDAEWFGCVEPLSEGWGGRPELARAAADIKHRDHYSTFFQIDTMQPLIDGTGYVRALEELAADAKLGPANPRTADLDAVRNAFLQGQTALAIAWPGHQRATKPMSSMPATGFCELPGSADVFNIADMSWEPRTPEEGVHVTLLGLSGRLASVCEPSAHANQAVQLLAWLSGKNWGGDIGAVSSASPATTLYRRSQMRLTQPWVDAGTDAEAARTYGEAVRDALNRPTYLLALRIPGHDRYLAALDAAVSEVLGGESTAADALTTAAARWNEITDELGRDAQRQAYHQSLGLEP